MFLLFEKLYKRAPKLFEHFSSFVSLRYIFIYLYFSSFIRVFFVGT